MIMCCFRFLSNENEFLCKDNFCVRSYEDMLIENGGGEKTKDVRCDGIWHCPDGSDESFLYAGCQDTNGKYKNILLSRNDNVVN